MLRGKELGEAVIQYIIDHPDEHNQSLWECGTQMCIGGRIADIAGYRQDGYAMNALYLLAPGLYARVAGKCGPEAEMLPFRVDGLGLAERRAMQPDPELYRRVMELFEDVFYETEDNALALANFKDWVSENAE